MRVVTKRLIKDVLEMRINGHTDSKKNIIDGNRTYDSITSKRGRYHCTAQQLLVRLSARYEVDNPNFNQPELALEIR